MSGTPTGGIQARETNRANYGADYYAKIGKKGGSVRNPRKGFGGNHERAVEAGKKGGTISRRRPKWMIAQDEPFSKGLEHAAEDAGR